MAKPITAFLIMAGVQSVSPVNQGDLFLVNSTAANSSITKVQSSWFCNTLAGTCSVTSASIAFATTSALFPHANNTIFFAFIILLIPTVIASFGTLFKSWNS